MSNSLAAVHPELIAEWSDRNLPLTPDSVTFGSNKKVWWKGACGHEWETSVKARSNGEKCPICSGARVVTGINDLSTLKPKLASEWSEKNEIKPTEVSIGSHKKVIWQCKQGHEWTATVRQKEDGRYELISGHRRKRASELAGFETLRCEVVDLNRDEATILMVESNFQRSQILPSEKAYAYKMRLDAMKRQAGRPSKENSDPVGPNLIGTRSNSLLAEETGDSTSQIKRYVRLTNLVPELLEFVDEGRIKMRPAVELSYLDEDCQRDVVDEIDMNDATPSHDQTIRMRKFFDEGKLTTEAIQAIMSEEKPNQKEKIVLRGDRVRQLIPKNIPISQTEDFVCKALEHYNKYLRQRAERDSR